MLLLCCCHPVLQMRDAAAETRDQAADKAAELRDKASDKAGEVSGTQCGASKELCWPIHTHWQAACMPVATGIKSHPSLTGVLCLYVVWQGMVMWGQSADELKRWQHQNSP